MGSVCCGGKKDTEDYVLSPEQLEERRNLQVRLCGILKPEI